MRKKSAAIKGAAGVLHKLAAIARQLPGVEEGVWRARERRSSAKR